MVNVSGLQRRSTYEEVAKAAELDEFRNLIKTPDRLPKTIIDAPSMTALDPENEEEFLRLMNFSCVHVLGFLKWLKMLCFWKCHVKPKSS